MKDDSSTTIQELKDLTESFVKEREWDKFHTPKDMAMNAIIELSELLDHFRFKETSEIVELLNNPSYKAEIANEFSDAFYSLLRLSDLLDIDMASELQTKLVEIGKKYPIEKAKGSNKKYNEL